VDQIKCLFKVSGDLFDKDRTLNLLWKLDKEYHYRLAVIPGAGTKTSQALEKAGLPVGDYLPFPKGRVVRDFKSRCIQAKEAMISGKEFQTLLATKNIRAEILFCAEKIGEILRPINGDELVIKNIAFYDIAFVLTTDERKEQKIKDFASYNADGKITIITPSDLWSF